MIEVLLEDVTSFRIQILINIQETVVCGYGPPSGRSLVDLMERIPGLWLLSLRDPVEHVGWLVDPTALCLRLWEDLLQSFPEAKVSVGNS